MPLTVPNLDDRRYQDLLDEALSRIPVYTPEWTNFNKSDPGVTLIEVFAFLTETLLYRCNQHPRAKSEEIPSSAQRAIAVCEFGTGFDHDQQR